MTFLSILRAPRWIFTAILVMALGGIAAAEPAGEAIHYWNGDSRVDVHLAFDETASRVAGKSGAEAWSVLALDGGDRQVLSKAFKTGLEHAVVYEGAARDATHRAFLSRRLSLCLPADQILDDILTAHGLTVVEEITYSERTWILEAADPLTALQAANALYEGGHAVFATPLISRQANARYTPNDTLLAQQWHLGLINATTAWDTANGNGVNIAIVDNGLQLTHPDLSGNARTDIDIDINDDDADSAPNVASDFHGTAVGGVAGGVGDNNLGIAGVAYEADLIGVRLIAAPTSDADDATAMNHRVSDTITANQVHVSNNSWGPSDDGSTVAALGPLMKAALQNATSNGRSGKGVCFVWAAGNGGSDDNSAYDGLSGNRYTIGVGAVTSGEVQADYSESGCNVMVCAPGGSVGTGIVCTDLTGANGYAGGDYTAIGTNIQGTSFSAPVVAGVAALVLEAEPNLTWRDMMHVLIRTAKQNDPGDGGWATNAGGASGLHFNHAYGFGLVQADEAVAAVAGNAWRMVPASATPLTASEQVLVAVPDNDATGITRTLSISAPARFRAEHVELTISAQHTWRGDLSFELTAPSGTKSLIDYRSGDNNDNFSNAIFTTVANWGENPSGTWSLKVVDHLALYTGNLSRWSLKVYGYIAPPAPVLTDVNPLFIQTGSTNTVVTLTGSNFDAWSVVEVDGTPVATTYVSSTQLQATIPTGMLAADGPLLVTVVSDGFMGEGGGTSAGITVTVSPPFAPYFIINPSDAFTFEPRGATFTARAVGLPEPTYTWERSDPGSMTWNVVPGASSRTLVLATTVESFDDGSSYRCVATNGGGFANSTAALLTVGGRIFGNGGGGGGGPCGGGGLGIGLILASLTLVSTRRRRW